MRFKISMPINNLQELKDNIEHLLSQLGVDFENQYLYNTNLYFNIFDKEDNRELEFYTQDGNMITGLSSPVKKKPKIIGTDKDSKIFKTNLRCK